MKAPFHSLVEGANMPPGILHYYEAIEKASAEMVEAARAGHWDDVVKLEGACMVLIGQLKLAAREAQLDADTRRAKSRIMQRILVNDAEIRHLAEPWLGDLEQMMGGKLKTIH
jgi:flagellar protein FliT